MTIANLLPWKPTLPTFARGIHPTTHKESTAGKQIEFLPTPEMVHVPLHQHAGAPAEAVVKPRTEVAVGDLIGSNDQVAITAQVHATVAGKVAPLTAVTLPNGRPSMAVPIKTTQPKPDGQPDANGSEGRSIWNAYYSGSWELSGLGEVLDQQIVAAVRRAGIVGMGGAGFPTHIKLARSPGRTIDVVVLNGCECEPYLTADHRMMVEAPQAICAGLLLTMNAVRAAEGVVAIESNKPDAIEAMRSVLDSLDHVRLVVCDTKYPMGAERQLIPTVLGREAPTGGIPLDVGVVVTNVGTAAAIATAVLRGKNMTHRVVSVSGQGIREPTNVFVPIGTSLRTVLDFCGGLTSDAQRVIAGGPMMGFTVTDLDAPVTKGTSGLTVLSRSEVEQQEQTTCIRCGRCVDVCPLGLTPTRIAHAAKASDLAMARRYDIFACCECGCCAYACPSHIPLAQYIRAGKAAIRRGS